jgi:hypothetical protein
MIDTKGIDTRHIKGITATIFLALSKVNPYLLISKSVEKVLNKKKMLHIRLKKIFNSQDIRLNLFKSVTSKLSFGSLVSSSGASFGEAISGRDSGELAPAPILQGLNSMSSFASSAYCMEFEDLDFPPKVSSFRISLWLFSMKQYIRLVMITKRSDPIW